jgi:hypothetical protein
MDFIVKIGGVLDFVHLVDGFLQLSVKVFDSGVLQLGQLEELLQGHFVLFTVMGVQVMLH